MLLDGVGNKRGDGSSRLEGLSECGLVLEEVRNAEDGETTAQAGGVTKEARASEDHIHSH